MSFGLLAGSAALAAIAMLGMAWPLLRRRTAPAIDSVSKDGSRAADLVRSLRALEIERREGDLSEDDYETLRLAAEARAARALRVAEVTQDEEVQPRPHSRRRAVGAILTVAMLVGVTVPTLRLAVRERDASGIISGDLGPGASARAADPFAALEERVRTAPEDVAGRLDLAHRYLDAGRAEQAVEHYLVVLGRDSKNPEALAHLGLLLFQSGRPDDALTAIDRALNADPRYPEALLFKGLVLLQGKKDPGAAIAPLEAYLDAAPFGSARGEAEQLLKEARSLGSAG